MRFTKVIGYTEDPKILALIKSAEAYITQAFMEMAMKVENKAFFAQVGGSPLTYQLMYPMPHHCDISALLLKDLEDRAKNAEGDELEKLQRQIFIIEALNPRGVLTTAATNGREFIFNPQFVCGLNKLGLRMLLEHEAFHAHLGHSERRKGRNPSLWNICIDYVVNRMILLDLKARGFYNPEQLFKDNLGDFIRLEELASMLVDPFNPPKRLEHFNPIHTFRSMANPGYQNPNVNKQPFFYADMSIGDDFRRPEYIYAYLVSKIPKCSKCGRFGCYEKPNEVKRLQKEIKANEQAQSQS